MKSVGGLFFKGKENELEGYQKALFVFPQIRQILSVVFWLAKYLILVWPA